MDANKVILDLKLSLNDMTSIAAACGTMSVMMMKEAECADDFKEAVHLRELHMRIDNAIRKAIDAKKAKQESKTVAN